MREACAARAGWLVAWAALLILTLSGGDVLAQAPSGGGGGRPRPGQGEEEEKKEAEAKPIEKRVKVEGQLVDVCQVLKARYNHALDAGESRVLLALVPESIQGEAVPKGMENHCFFLVPSAESGKILSSPADVLGRLVTINGNLYKTQHAAHVESFVVGVAAPKPPLLPEDGAPMHNTTVEGRVIDVTSTLILSRGLDESLKEQQALRAVKVRRAHDAAGTRVTGLSPNDIFYLLPSPKADEVIAAADEGKRYVEITGSVFPNEQVIEVVGFTASAER